MDEEKDREIQTNEVEVRGALLWEGEEGGILEGGPLFSNFILRSFIITREGADNLVVFEFIGLLTLVFISEVDAPLPGAPPPSFNCDSFSIFTY